MSENSICPNSPGYIQGSYIKGDGSEVVSCRHQLRCNSWSCPVCNPRKVKTLRKRIFSGQIMSMAEPRSGYRFNPYMVKLFTFTCPGRDFRSKYSPAEAEKKMKQDLNRLRTITRNHYGKEFQYLLIVEPQKDNYPHFHVLFVGESISDKSFYWFIRKYWNDRYGQGFVWVSKPNKFKSAIHAFRYITKYLTKCFKPIVKRGRIFTCSRRALAPRQKTVEWLNCKIFMGRLSPSEYVYRREVNLNCPLPVYQALDPTLQKRLYPDLYEFLNPPAYSDTIPF